ncbi:hypothetical protein [Desulfonatronum sp. SC1]|uniref:hypothetical protein n=1 Tax=Desulfonatronum sp. SC1 TaxID=2109626 RepID=UPI0011B2572C|nr:hypothetical protein [Desulfonatronum sp. SC1]
MEHPVIANAKTMQHDKTRERDNKARRGSVEYPDMLQLSWRAPVMGWESRTERVFGGRAMRRRYHLV